MSPYFPFSFDSGQDRFNGLLKMLTINFLHYAKTRYTYMCNAILYNGGKAMNPFQYGQVVKKTDFCKRPKLEKELTANIREGQNVYIQGERRIGKTSLIWETVRKVTKCRMMYIDFLAVKASDDFIKRIITGIISLEKSAGSLEKIFQKLSRLRPVASIDPITGLPTLSLDSSIDLKPDSVPGVVDLIASYHTKSKPVVVVFDEFQDVLNMKDFQEILALLRSKIQFLSDICFIFAGSIRNKMDLIFNDPNSAFYKSAKSIQVGPINKDSFQKFIRNKFETGKRQIPFETLGAIFKICFNIPGDVQQLCSALWDTTSSGTRMSENYIQPALERIFSNELRGYEASLNILTKQQLKLLTGLARLGGKAPMSSDFMKQSGIIQASSIKRALNRLIHLNIIFYIDNEYRFVNPFFRAWLLYKKL